MKIIREFIQFRKQKKIEKKNAELLAKDWEIVNLPEGGFRLQRKPFVMFDVDGNPMKP